MGTVGWAQPMGLPGTRCGSLEGALEEEELTGGRVCRCAGRSVPPPRGRSAFPPDFSDLMLKLISDPIE